MYSLAVSDSNIVAGTSGGAFFSSNDGDNWQAADNGFSVCLSLAAKGSTVFGASGFGAYRSIDDGKSWQYIGLQYDAVTSFVFHDTSIFAGTIQDGVIYSTNSGVGWQRVNFGLTNTTVRALIGSGINLFASTDSGIFRSSNDGAIWTKADSGIIYPSALSFAVNDSYIFAASTGYRVFRSSNNGETWEEADSGIGFNTVESFTTSGSNIFAGTQGGGIYLSTNNGTSWCTVNEGLQNYRVPALAIRGTSIYAATYGGGVWRRPLAEMVTSVNQSPGTLPQQFVLEQNYPNPFNSGTTIKFSVPGREFVSLRVFNVLGQDVSVLLSETVAPGECAVRWDASHFPSGIYFYRLQTSLYSETRKLLLLK